MINDFNEFFTYMIIEMQKEAFDKPAKADELNRQIADLWVQKASLRISEERGGENYDGRIYWFNYSLDCL